jgi:aromatic ring hydroxylase
VFVPNERILLNGEVSQASVFARSLGLRERLGGLSSMADGADTMVGLAQPIVAAPSIWGLENPDVGPLARKYMTGDPDEGDREYRARLLHAIRDLTADTYGG